MSPILFEIAGFEVHAYGALGALAFVVGCAIVLWRAHRQGHDVNAVADVIFWGSVAALLGSRLLFVAQHPEVVQSPLDLFDVRSGGLVFYGSFLLGLPVVLLLLRRARLPVLGLMDIFSTGLPLAHGISRVGCFLAGCCYGRPSHASWAVTFPEGGALTPGGIPLHPVQLYEAGLLWLIALATNLWYPRRRFDGQVFALYLGLYAGVRTITEAFRGDVSRGFVLPGWLGSAVSFSQGLSVLVAVGAAVVFVVGARRARS